MSLADNCRHFYKFLGNLGANVKIKTSRYNSQYKCLQISTSLDPIEFFAGFGLEAKIMELDPETMKLISGKYSACLCEIEGKQFYLVNTFTERGYLKNKDLVPEQLGVVGKTYVNLDDFTSDLKYSIIDLDVGEEIKSYMTKIYDLTTSSNTIHLDDDLKNLQRCIGNTDIQIIGKNYGEVIAMKHLLEKYPYDQFEFSGTINQRLVDCKLTYNSEDMNVSVKFDRGSAPAISSILHEIYRIENPSDEEKSVIDVLKELGNKHTSNNILNISRKLDLPAYENIKKILDANNVTLESLSKDILNLHEKYDSLDDRVVAYNDRYKPVYDSLGTQPKEESIKAVLSEANYRKPYSLVISPMGYSIVRMMNGDEKYINFLARLVESLDIKQLYIKIKSSMITFDEKSFKDSKFTFAYNGNAKDSDVSGIKFNMVR